MRRSERGASRGRARVRGVLAGNDDFYRRGNVLLEVRRNGCGRIDAGAARGRALSPLRSGCVYSGTLNRKIRGSVARDGVDFEA
jgi:hypothetical protein